MKLARSVSQEHDTLALRARTGLSHEGAQDVLAGRTSSRTSDQLIGTRVARGDVEGLGGRLPVAPKPIGKPPKPTPVPPVRPVKPPVNHPAPTPPRPHPVPRPGSSFDGDEGLGRRFSR
ncbi:MAG: hypothetical protein AABZ53_13745 [Planctomycetota bacterium]